MTLRILLLGSTGQVGWELHRALLPLGEITALDYPQIDMAEPDSIRQVVRDTQPEVVINATAFTDVDQAESLPDFAMAINGTGPGVLAEEAQRLGAALIHYSTDYVFDGTNDVPYTENDEPNPVNVYGRTKLAGETAVLALAGPHLIFRTSWVYSLRKACFVTKVLAWSRKQETLQIVSDQISSPTWARTLAETTAHILAQAGRETVPWLRERGGLYHLAGGGACSRFEWAQAVLALDPDREEQVVKQIQPAESSDFVTAAQRPLYTALSCKKLEATFDLVCPPWELALKLLFQ